MKDILLNNGYPISFIDKWFKTFLDQPHLKRPQALIAEKKMLALAFLFPGELSLQTRTKLQKVLTLSCCKIEIVFKNQRNLTNVFSYKDRLLYDLVSFVMHKFQCRRYNAYSETDRNLKVRSGEHIGISPINL